MRLINFLNENISNEKLEKECQFYLNFKKKYNCKFYKGIHPNTDISRKIKLKTRELKAIKSQQLNDTIKKWFKKHNILERENSIPLTTNFHIAMRYNDLICEVFPIGKFEYSWCKSSDFNLNEEWDQFQLAYIQWMNIKENSKNWNEKIWIGNISNLYTLMNDFNWKNVSDININKLPENYTIDFDYQILSKKHIFTVAELEEGIKKLPSLIKTNTNVEEAIKNSYEIWINPTEFYLIKTLN